MEKGAIGSRAFKKFFRKLVIAGSHIKEREKAKEEVSEHITKIKRLAAHPRIKKETVAAELEKLNKRIAEIIEGEKRVIKKQEEEGDIIAAIQKRLERLEAQVGELKGEPISRIKERALEKKRAQESRLLEMEKQIYAAEKRYAEAEEKGVKDKSLLRDLRKRIEDSKRLLEKLKTK